VPLFFRFDLFFFVYFLVCVERHCTVTAEGVPLFFRVDLYLSFHFLLFCIFCDRLKRVSLFLRRTCTVCFVCFLIFVYICVVWREIEW
jgi:hypothetical protein